MRTVEPGFKLAALLPQSSAESEASTYRRNVSTGRGGPSWRWSASGKTKTRELRKRVEKVNPKKKLILVQRKI